MAYQLNFNKEDHELAKKEDRQDIKNETKQNDNSIHSKFDQPAALAARYYSHHAAQYYRRSGRRAAS